MDGPTPFAVPLRLTPDDVDEAREGALGRQRYAESHGFPERKGAGAGLVDSREKALLCHFKGAVGELALARLLGVQWNPNVGGDRRAPDVVYCDARFSSNVGSPLTLYPYECRERPHCLIVGPLPPSLVWFVGWIYGFNGADSRWWRPDFCPGGAWRIPQAELLPWPVPVERFHYRKVA